MREEQIKELTASILKSAKSINQVLPANKDLSEVMKENLKDYSDLRGKGFPFPFLASGEGNGPFIKGQDGSVKYNLVSSLGTNILGHSHPVVLSAQITAALNDSTMGTNILPHEESYLLTKEILKHTGNSKLEHFWFAGSGSFANDLALKIIWQKTNPRYRIISLKDGFSGRSIAMQEISYDEEFREGMPKILPVSYAPNYDQKKSLTDNIDQTLKRLNQILNQYPNEIAALQLELIQGEAGVIFGPKEYYKAVFEWAKQNSLYIWVDEVQSFCRSTEMFAFQHFELAEYVDVVTVGKALQVCGVLFSKELNPKPGLISGTFTGSLVSLKVGTEILNYLATENYFGSNGKIKKLEIDFQNKLKKLKQEFPGKISEVGGIGLMHYIELTGGDFDQTQDFIQEVFHAGIIAFDGGFSPCRVRFLLPISLSETDLSKIFSILGTTIRQMLSPKDS